MATGIGHPLAGTSCVATELSGGLACCVTRRRTPYSAAVDQLPRGETRLSGAE